MIPPPPDRESAIAMPLSSPALMRTSPRLHDRMHALPAAEVEQNVRAPEIRVTRAVGQPAHRM
jgi:hypothetical protein